MARPADPHARSALLAAARAEFARVGIVAARIEDVATAAGLSKGAFYLHFESKEAAFAVVVEELKQKFDALNDARYQAYRAVIDGATPGPHLLALMGELDRSQDRLLLEMLWDWRDVLSVLLEGARGTRFEGVIWDILDVEVERVRKECAGMQRLGVTPSDIDGQVLGQMVVGTYLLVARSLIRARHKPDFEKLVAKLHRLVGPALVAAPPGNGAGGPIVSGPRVSHRPARQRSTRSRGGK